MVTIGRHEVRGVYVSHYLAILGVPNVYYDPRPSFELGIEVQKDGPKVVDVIAGWGGFGWTERCSHMNPQRPAGPGPEADEEPVHELSAGMLPIF